MINILRATAHVASWGAARRGTNKTSTGRAQRQKHEQDSGAALLGGDTRTWGTRLHVSWYSCACVSSHANVRQTARVHLRDLVASSYTSRPRRVRGPWRPRRRGGWNPWGCASEG